MVIMQSFLVLDESCFCFRYQNTSRGYNSRYGLSSGTDIKTNYERFDIYPDR